MHLTLRHTIIDKHVFTTRNREIKKAARGTNLIPALVIVCGLTLSACASKPEPAAETPAAPTPAEAAGDSAQQGSPTQASFDPVIPFFEQVDYERLPHDFDPVDNNFDPLDLCTDEFAELYLRYGMQVTGEKTTFDVSTNERPYWSCEVRELKRGVDGVFIVNSPEGKDHVRDVDGSFHGDAVDSWIPGAYYITTDDPTSGLAKCEFAVDTPRGRIGIRYEGEKNSARLVHYCNDAKLRMEDLFRDKEFMLAVYGEQLPRK